MNDAARALLVEHIRHLTPQKATTAKQRAARLTGLRRDLLAIAERIETLRAELEGTGPAQIHMARIDALRDELEGAGPAQEDIERAYNAEHGEWRYNAAMTLLGDLAYSAPCRRDLAHARKWAAVTKRINAPRTELEGAGPVQEDAERIYNAAMTMLGDLARSARRAADELPKPQSRPALAFAAACWLHIESLELDKRLTLYDDGPGVQSLKSLCEEAGLVRSDDAVRKALAVAMKSFDRYCPPPDVAEFLDELSGLR